jgi:hypothetical protein
MPCLTIPFHSNPLHFIQFHSIQSISFHSNPFHFISFHFVHIHSCQFVHFMHFSSSHFNSLLSNSPRIPIIDLVPIAMSYCRDFLPGKEYVCT